MKQMHILFWNGSKQKRLFKNYVLIHNNKSENLVGLLVIHNQID